MTRYSLIPDEEIVKPVRDGDRKSYDPRHTNPFSSSPEDNLFAKRPEFGGLASFMDEGLESSAGQILKIMKEEGLNKARRERMKAVGGIGGGERIEELNRGLQGAIGTYNKGRKSQGGNKNSPPKEATFAGQQHELAYITPQEGNMLKQAGGSGDMTE